MPHAIVWLHSGYLRVNFTKLHRIMHLASAPKTKVNSSSGVPASSAPSGVRIARVSCFRVPVWRYMPHWLGRTVRQHHASDYSCTSSIVFAPCLRALKFRTARTDSYLNISSPDSLHVTAVRMERGKERRAAFRASSPPREFPGETPRWPHSPRHQLPPQRILANSACTSRTQLYAGPCTAGRLASSCERAMRVARPKSHSTPSYSRRR